MIRGADGGVINKERLSDMAEDKTPHLTSHRDKQRKKNLKVGRSDEDQDQLGTRESTVCAGPRVLKVVILDA